MARYSRSQPDPLTPMMNGPREPRARTAITANFTWIDDKNPAKTLATTIRRLVVDQNSRLLMNARFASLYANEDYLRPYRQTGEKARPSMPRQTLNKIKSNTDTLAGKLIQSNSRVQATTVRGDWETFKLARKIGRVLDTTFVQGRLFRETSKVVIDGINTGNGYLYIGEEDGKVCYERWYYNEIFVDQLDAMYGRPSMMFRIRYMYPENALALWGDTPEHIEAINRAPRAIPPTFSWTPYEQGMIEVFEGWALELPHRKGRHVLCTAVGTLKDTDYKRSTFPVVNFRVSDLPLGWYGQGFTAHSSGTQIWLNRILDIMSRSAHLGMAPYWIVQGGAEISLKQLNNVEGHIVTSNGPAPTWVTPPPFHEAAPAYVELLSRHLDVIYGISEIESSGSMPFNRVDSNPALIQTQDMWMARHTILLKNYSEEFFMDVAERTMEVAQDIAKRNGSYPVVASAQGRAWAMDWKDFTEMKRESYRLQLMPENALSLTPAARKKMIMDMAASGQLPQEQALGFMMGSSDVEAVSAQVSAYENNADWICEELMEGRIPDLSSLQKPEIVWARIRAAGLSAHEFGAPDNIIQAFETFGAMVLDRVQQDQQQQMALMAPAGQANGNPAAPGPGPAA